MTLRIPFWKYQSIGNDFPIVHLADVEAALAFAWHEKAVEDIALEVPPQVTAGCSIDPTELPPFEGVPSLDDALAQLSIAINDRRYGVGGDGLLAMGQEGDGVLLRMFNPDGTEDFCGNGLRCAAVHAHTQGWVGEEFTIRHLGHEVRVKLGGGRVSTWIGTASYAPDRVPLQPGTPEIFRDLVFYGDGVELRGSALTTGSTHVIIPVETLPEDSAFGELSPLIENFDLYPDRTSVIWTQEVGANHLRLRIWERGVGETLGCGTGSSAAAADYLRASGEGGTVTVDNPGGTVRVTMPTWNGPIEIDGVAEKVFSGEYRFILAL